MNTNVWSPGPPTGSMTSTNTTWRRLNGVSTAACVLLVLTTVGAFVQAMALAHRLQALRDLESIDALDQADKQVQGAVVLVGLLMAATLVLLIVWMFRAAKNVQALSRTGASWGPRWAIGAWFVPGAWWLLPFIVAAEIYRGSAPERTVGFEWRKTKGSPLVWLWMACWVAACLAWIIFPRDLDNPLTLEETLRDQRTYGFVIAVLLLLAAVFAIGFIRATTARFGEALINAQQAAMSQAAQMAPAPSGYSTYVPGMSGVPVGTAVPTPGGFVPPPPSPYGGTPGAPVAPGSLPPPPPPG
ncbi:MAG: DUF4328 domain-containing protein [Acidimicrobiia bacterium]